MGGSEATAPRFWLPAALLRGHYVAQTPPGSDFGTKLVPKADPRRPHCRQSRSNYRHASCFLLRCYVGTVAGFAAGRWICKLNQWTAVDPLSLKAKIVSQGAGGRGRRPVDPPPPCGASHRVHGVPRLSIELLFPENFLSKRSPGGVRPVPPVPGQAQSCDISRRLFSPKWPKMASKIAQNGQDGASFANMASKVVPSGPKRLPRSPHNGPRRPQDASRGAPGGQNC